MNEREKKIVILMAIVVVIAVIYFVLEWSSSGEAKPKAQEKGLVGLLAFVSETKKSVDEIKVSEAGQQVIKVTAKAWLKDPFLQNVTAEELGSSDLVSESISSSEFVYSGFLQLGSMKMAVIDGMEYEVGDEVEDQGMIVVEIHPDRIVLEDISMESFSDESSRFVGARQFVVPLVE